MDFFDTTTKELETSSDLQFTDKEIVSFTINDYFVDRTHGNLKLNCTVNSGTHAGKKYPVRISSADNDAAKKRKLQFLKAFWTVDEINAKQCNPARLIGKSFTAKSTIAKSKKEGDNRTFQNWDEFTAAQAPDGQAPTQAQPSPQDPTQAPQQAGAMPSF